MVVLITKKTVGFISSVDCWKRPTLPWSSKRPLSCLGPGLFTRNKHWMFFLGISLSFNFKNPKKCVLISFFSATYVSVCSNKTDKNWKGNSTLGWCHRQFCHPVRPETPSSETSIVGDILWHLRNLSQVWPGPNTFMHCISPNWLKMENIHPYLDRNRSRSLC